MKRVEETFFVMADENKIGPFSRRKLAAYYVVGAIKHDDLACASSMGIWSWVPLRELLDLKQLREYGRSLERQERRLAPRKRRISAAVYDLLYLYGYMLIGIPVSWLVHILPWMVISGYMGSRRVVALTLIISCSLYVLLFCALQYYMLCKTGQTLGRRLAKVKVIGIDGRQPDLKHITLRTFLPFAISPLPMIGAIAMMVSIIMFCCPKRRTLYDRFAKTCVIYYP
ncbi:MAG: RDD family protein [Verrucomicrobia bacterium]|nr:RDD family protein [Verrucomicrobiota bacterium]